MPHSHPTFAVAPSATTSFGRTISSDVFDKRRRVAAGLRDAPGTWGTDGRGGSTGAWIIEESTAQRSALAPTPSFFEASHRW